jgi:hypothetical protein
LNWSTRLILKKVLKFSGEAIQVNKVLLSNKATAMPEEKSYYM